MASFIRIASASVRLLMRHSQRAGQFRGVLASPPSRRSDRALSLAGYWGFNAALLVSAVLLLGFLAIASNAVWLAWLKVGLGVPMAAEGFLLARDWRGARRLVLWRIQQRRGARVGESGSLSRVLLLQLASPTLALLGVTWVAAGTLSTALGVARLL